MEYLRKERKNYNIYLLKTKNFKTINVSFVFQRKNTAEDELYRNLLENILFLKTEKYANLAEANTASAKIYSPLVYITAKSSFEYRTFSLNAEFANEKYTEKGMNKDVLEFVMDYFWHPYIKDGAFDKEVFELCKKNYMDSLKSAKNYPDEYSLERFWEIAHVNKFDMLSYDELIKRLEKIDEFQLYEYYKSMFTNDSLEIFVAGDVDDDIIEVIDNYITGNFSAPAEILTPKYDDCQVSKVIEEMDIVQSKLFLGYKILNSTEYEEKYVAFLLSMILGGGTESYLHKEVRTNKSLCYYIYSSYYNIFNLLLITAGISAERADEVIDIIKKQISKIQNGDINEEKILEVKQLYKNILLESKDSQSSILNNLISKITKGTDDIDERLKRVEDITKDDIINLSKKIKLDTIYLLEGKRYEKE